MKKYSWQEVVITIVGMAFLFGIACLASFVWAIDGKILIGTGIAIACLANSDILKLVIQYLPKYIPKNKR